MSGGPFIVGGMVGVLLGVSALGFGFFRTQPDIIYSGAGVALAGYIMIQIGRRMPY